MYTYLKAYQEYKLSPWAWMIPKTPCRTISIHIAKIPTVPNS